MSLTDPDPHAFVSNSASWRFARHKVEHDPFVHHLNHGPDSEGGPTRRDADQPSPIADWAVKTALIPDETWEAIVERVRALSPEQLGRKRSRA